MLTFLNGNRACIGYKFAIFEWVLIFVLFFFLSCLPFHSCHSIFFFFSGWVGLLYNWILFCSFSIVSGIIYTLESWGDALASQSSPINPWSLHGAWRKPQNTCDQPGWYHQTSWFNSLRDRPPCGFCPVDSCWFFIYLPLKVAECSISFLRIIFLLPFRFGDPNAFFIFFVEVSLALLGSPLLGTFFHTNHMLVFFPPS